MTQDNDKLKEEFFSHFPIGAMTDIQRAYMCEIADWWLSKLTQARKETAKAFGDCEKCYGKGYHTQIEVISWGKDFEGDKSGSRQLNLMNFCDCDRGNQLKMIVTQKINGTAEAVINYIPESMMNGYEVPGMSLVTVKQQLRNKYLKP